MHHRLDEYSINRTHMTHTVLFLLAFALLVGLWIYPSTTSLPSSAARDFGQWKRDNNVTYTAQENIYRQIIFYTNLAEIDNHNSNPLNSYRQGINRWTALTDEEFKSLFLTSFEAVQSQDFWHKGRNDDDEIDWVAKGAVGEVRDQGSSCLSGYAFSAVGAIESLHFISNNEVVELSVQQVIDCSTNEGNTGCSGGRMDNSYIYATKYGLTTNSLYPYEGEKKNCQSFKPKVRIYGYKNATGCAQLEDAILNQPVAVAVDGNHMKAYESGIFSNCATSLSLPLLLVGMTPEFWKLKNSWGSDWGEQGYIRLSRGNTCGICAMPSYPLPQ